MKTSSRTLTETKVELAISLDASDLQAAEQVALVKLAKTTKVPGFRKGKAPASIAAKHVNPELLGQQTLEDALSKAVAESFIENKIQALERPAVEIKKYVPGSLLEFTAEAETLPKVTLGDYKNLSVKRSKPTVTASEIDEIIERMRPGLADKKEVKRAALTGDEATINFTGSKGGVPFEGGTGSDYPLILGSNSFIAGFEEGIIGKKPGETFDLNLQFPDSYHVAELKGADVTFTTTLTKLREVKLPEINDDFAKKAGPFQTVKELKDDIKRELAAQKDREATEKLKDEMVLQLVDASQAAVPEVLLREQADSMERDMVQNLTYQHLTLDQYIESRGYKTKEEWLDNEVRPAAKKRVQAGLVLAELSKVEKIEATNQELDEHAAMYRRQYASNPEMVAQFDKPEARRDIANRLLTEKTVQRLVELNS